MSFDALVMAAVKDELQEKITGMRVQQVRQPERHTLVLHLHGRGRSEALLLSCHPRWARVHLTRERLKQPEHPAPFCMLLRKYLVGGAVKEIRQPPLERILEIFFTPPEGLPPTRLVAEIMGRRSNLILVDGEGVVLGAVRTATADRNPLRPVFPGEPYRPAPLQKKLDPLTAPAQAIAEAVADLVGQGLEPQEALVRSVRGIGPVASLELLRRAGWDPACVNASALRLAAALQSLLAEMRAGRWEPVLVEDSDTFAPYRLASLPEDRGRRFNSISLLLDHYYSRQIAAHTAHRLREQLKRQVEQKLARLLIKKSRQQKELEEAGEGDLYRLYGELLLTYAGRVPRGKRQVELPHLYHPGETVTVPLDPSLTAGANANKYFARYRKAQKGEKLIREQLSRTEGEILYCRDLLFAIDSGDRSSLEEIRQELMEAGYLKEGGTGKPKKIETPRPHFFKTSSGRTVLVGMNNLQNDYVTFRAASRRDIWLHVRDLPGSHVILKDAPYPPPLDDLEEAALLAAYFSRGRDSAAVAVDYTQVRHVRRRPQSRPGAVFYENHRTITVNPRDPRLNTLLQKKEKALL